MSVLAAFVWPSLFVGGACAVSLPVIIHLLARRRFKRIRWAAIEFLLQAERRNRRRVRLEDLILMLLRCLAVFLIAMLVARPFFRPEGLAALLGGSDRTERVFVLDDSFSMGYAVGDDTVFDRAKRGVRQIIELLREQSPHDTVTVLLTSAMDVPVSAGVLLDERQTSDLFARIDGLRASAYGLSARDVFQSLRGMLEEQATTVNVAVYVLSDFQRKDWVTAGGAEGGSSAIAPLGGAGWADQVVKLILVDVGEEVAPNMALTGLTSERSRFVAGVSGPVEVTLANFSDQTRASVDLDVSLGPTAQPTVTVNQVPGGESSVARLSVAFPRPGWHWVRVSTEADALPVDDQRSLVVDTVEAVRVLVVNGEPSTDSYRDEVSLFVTALRPPGEVFSGNDVRVIDETELDDTEFSVFDVVVLANVYRVSEATSAKLSEFAAGGGGVAIMLGDQVDPGFYNETLYRDGSGVLPVRLGDRLAPPSGAHLVPDDGLHAMVRVLSGRGNPFAERIRFEQYFGCTLPPVRADAREGEADDAVEAGDSVVVDRAKVVAHFDDADRTPAVVERTFGAGRVTLFTSSCDLEWNDWVKDPSYVVAMLELVNHLAQGRGTGDVVVGERIEFTIDPATYDTDVLVRTPAYPAEQEIALTATPADDGKGFRVRWDQTGSRGIYQFVLNRQTGEQEVRAIAVNLDSAESDLSFAGRSDLEASLTEMPFTYVDGLKSLDVVGEEARRELWKTVLLVVMVVLMGEQFLAWWFGRRD